MNRHIINKMNYPILKDSPKTLSKKDNCKKITTVFFIFFVIKTDKMQVIHLLFTIKL